MKKEKFYCKECEKEFETDDYQKRPDGEGTLFAIAYCPDCEKYAERITF
jgi:NAD-dependent SIR2 family protein deacetylase